jgi:hypothetical protein
VAQVVAWLAATLATCSGAADARPLSITAIVQGSPQTVSIDPAKYAGAIDSITYRGVQFIDTYDHGRELQSAIDPDSLGECLNPTEAGTRADGRDKPTSSETLLATNRSNTLRTVTRPAFWLSPGEDYGHACTGLRPEHAAQNRTVLSDYRIARTTRFFGPRDPHLLMIEMAFTIPDAHQSLSIEALTGYLPPQFTAFYSYAPATRTLTALRASTADSRSPLPVIVATPDGRNAMGVMSADTGAPSGHGVYYAYYYFPGVGGTAKWSCAYDLSAIPARAVLHYACPVAIGTLDEVKRAMDLFHGLSGHSRNAQVRQ